MCGLIALLGTPHSTFSSSTLDLGLDHLIRRGPDAQGVWQHEGVWFGHRRLAIQDLDARSNQPMHSSCGRYTIVFNGEIYNFALLRSELAAKGVLFRTTCDTEVLLALFAAHGQAMLEMLRGMFAFVIWDRIAKCAFTARDPYGIKPLYWAQTADGVLLASQVRALLATGQVSHDACPKGQTGFWLLGSVPEPNTWYKDIQALPSGHFAWIKDGRMGTPVCWWDISAAWRDAPATLVSDDEVRERTHAALRASVAAHLVADVPVGVFLSGGIDSGALAGLMIAAGVQNLQGITLAYDEFTGSLDDEAPLAKQVARHYGITHHIRRVSREEFAADLPRILAAMDQPSVDGINTWYATKAVAELGLKVVVSGVGGDELFQGYPSFRQLPPLVAAWAPLSRVPGAMPLARVAMDWQARRSGNARWRHLPDWARTMAGAWWLRRGLYSPDELPALMGIDLANDGLRNFCPNAWLGEISGGLAQDGRLAVGQIESTSYLRNQLLRDSDWASMDHSVELRTPLVDAWLLRDVAPMLGAFRRFPGKQLLAQAPTKPLPSALINRPKTGFSIPVQQWLKQMGRGEGDNRPSHALAHEVARVYDESKK
jgi:asparagine synthase (glutamine-hydrolysing)